MKFNKLYFALFSLVLAGGGYYGYQQYERQQQYEWHQQYQQLQTQFDKGEYKAVLPHYRKLAEQGYAPAQLQLYKIYFKGLSVKENIEQAVEWLKKAADQGNSQAQALLTVHYRFGVGIEENNNQALKYGNLAMKDANAVNSVLLTILAYIYQAEKDEDKARELALQAAEFDDEYALGLLGMLYDLTFVPISAEKIKRSFELDYEKMLEYYSQAAEKGNPFGSVMVKLQAEREDDPKEKIRLLNIAAQGGDDQAQYQLANLYYFGEGVEKDFELAAKWYERAAKQGYKDAYFYLGYLYDSGKGVDQSNRSAKGWYEAAAENGDSAAQNNLANLLLEDYHKGKKSEDLAAAVKWYKKAAEQGNDNSQDRLGKLYRDGTGVDQSYAQALKWFKKAAEQENMGAFVYLGLLYENGQGVPQDNKQAVDWYKKAAEQGSAIGQTNLAFMYENGKGVKQDYQQAEQWYIKAANQSHMRAIFNLADLYKSGKRQKPAGQPDFMKKAAEQGNAEAQFVIGLRYDNAENYAQAIIWYKKAALQNHAGA